MADDVGEGRVEAGAAEATAAALVAHAVDAAERAADRRVDPRGVVQPPGEWNHVRIVVNGNHVEHWLNGQRIVEYELGSPDWQARVAKSKFAKWRDFGRASAGYIDLQDHGDRVAVKNIKIQVLP